MTVIEKAFALQSVPAFAQLRIQDLTAIARVAGYRQFAPGSVAYSSDYTLKDLVVVVNHELVDSRGIPVPPVIGIGSLLKDQEIGTDLSAGEDGAECLLIGRGHFFTMIHQCPEIVRGLVDQSGDSVRKGRVETKQTAEDALFV